MVRVQKEFPFTGIGSGCSSRKSACASVQASRRPTCKRKHPAAAGVHVAGPAPAYALPGAFIPCDKIDATEKGRPSSGNKSTHLLVVLSSADQKNAA